MTTRPTRTITAASLAAVLLLSACGSSGDSDAAETTAAAADEAAETTAAVAAETTAPAEQAETTAAPADTTAAVDTTAAAETTAPADTAAPAAAAADYELVEWAINGSASLAAGSVTFNVTNGGNFPHEFVVIKGDSYTGLPLASSGAVEEDQLEAEAFIGETQRLDPGASATLTVDLAAGRYVLLCNITGGGSSHAARGQVLEVEVA